MKLQHRPACRQSSFTARRATAPPPPSLQRLLAQLPLDQIARDTGADTPQRKKIAARQLLLAFVAALKPRPLTLSRWAEAFTCLTGIAVTRQAIWARLTPAMSAFFAGVIRALLAHRFVQHLGAAAQQATSGLGGRFGRVLVEDSTLLRLPLRLRPVLPARFLTGAVRGDPEGRRPRVRLHLVYDLLGNQVVDLDLSGYRDNDQSRTEAVLAPARAGDLLLRDLGFFSLRVLRQLLRRGIHTVTPLSFRVHVETEPQPQGQTQGQPQELSALLAEAQRRGVQRLDLPVRVGATEHLPMRLVGFRLSKAAATRRCRQARQDARRRPTAPYLASLSWQLFLTDLAPEAITADEVRTLYRLRWRIETFFKAIKRGGLALETVLETPHQRVARLEMTLSAVLVLLVAVVVPFYRYFAARIEGVSLLRWALLVREHLTLLLAWGCRRERRLLKKLVQQYCRYDRRNRTSYPLLLDLPEVL